MTKTDAAVQTLSDINPDVVLEVSTYIVNSSYVTTVYNQIFLGFVIFQSHGMISPCLCYIPTNSLLCNT